MLSYLFHCRIAREQRAPDSCHQSCTRSHFHSCLQFHTAKRKGQATSYIVRKPQGSQLLGTSNKHAFSVSPREVHSQDMHLNPECSSPVQQTIRQIISSPVVPQLALLATTAHTLPLQSACRMQSSASSTEPFLFRSTRNSTKWQSCTDVVACMTTLQFRATTCKQCGD